MKTLILSLKSFLLPFTLLSLFATGPAMAQGDLLITPKRLVFDGKKRTQEINLANIGKDTAQYAISFLQLRMKQDGSFEQITQPDSGQRFADKFLRIFPRSVTLAPGEAQSVKVQVLQYSTLAEGEYRSHLYFRAQQKESPLVKRSEKTEGVSIRLTPIFGVSIPIIIRSGASNVKVSLSSLKLSNTPERELQLQINRSGNMSVYGDLRVEHISDKGKVKIVGVANGVGVYTPNSARTFRIRLDSKSDFRSGKLRVTYSGSNSNAPFTASAELPLLRQ